jgi:uncharacterized membrane protein (UPF0127 family)
MLTPEARRRRRGGKHLRRARLRAKTFWAKTSWAKTSWAACLLALALGCGEADQQPVSTAAPAAPASPAETIFLPIGGETFTLELALDPATRQRGLGGRANLSPSGGMLFAFRSPRPLSMVMRDCPEPIDVAFLDAAGRVVAVHEMPPEPPRRPGETAFQYERRLPEYASGAPAQFAVEVAGGRLAQLGVGVGSRIPFDAAALAGRAR